MENGNLMDTGLRKALEALKEHQGQKESAAVAAEMLKGKVLAPAIWDKAPAPDGHGQLVFPPDTNISLMVMERQDKKNFFRSSPRSRHWKNGARRRSAWC